MEHPATRGWPAVPRPGLVSPSHPPENGHRHTVSGADADLVIGTARLDDGTFVVSVEGELDMANAAMFKEKLLDAVASSAQAVVVDLTDCGFIDSSGLNALVQALGPGRARLSLIGAQPHLLKVLEITHLDEVLALSSTRETAQDGDETNPVRGATSQDGPPVSNAR